MVRVGVSIAEVEPGNHGTAGTRTPGTRGASGTGRTDAFQDRDLPGVVRVVLHDAVKELVHRDARAERAVARILRRAKHLLVGEMSREIDKPPMRGIERIDRGGPSGRCRISDRRIVTG